MSEWRLVPVEPTEAMRKAACHALRDYIESIPLHEREGLWGKPIQGRGYRIPDKEKHAVRYRAMVAAAAVAPSPEISNE